MMTTNRANKEEKAKTLNVVELSNFLHRRPVVKVDELSKTNIVEYFNDGLTEK